MPIAQNSFILTKSILNMKVQLFLFPFMFCLTSLFIHSAPAPASGKSDFDTELNRLRDSLRPKWQEAKWIREHRRQTFSQYYPGPNFTLNDLKSQIEDAVTRGESKVTVKPGTYLAPKLGNGKTMLELKNITNLEIDAKGAVLMGQSPNRFLDINSCASLSIKGLILDTTSEGLPFTQGTVVGTKDGGKTIELQIHEGFPLPHNKRDTTRKVEAYDADTLLLSEGIPTIYQTSYTINGRNVTLSLTQPSQKIKEGMYLVLLNEENSGHGVVIKDSSRITLEKVKIHCAPMFAVLSSGSSEIRYSSVEITPGPMLPGSTIPRLKSGNQDGIHINDMSGPGDIIEDCFIECHSDDAIALNAGYSIVLKKEKSTYYVTAKHGDMNLDAGQQVVQTRIKDMQTLGTSKISSIEKIQNKELIDELDRLKESICESYDIRKAGLEGKSFWKITLENPKASEEAEFFSPYSDNYGVKIRRNYIANHRARSLLLKTSGAVVEDNTIFHSMNSTIVMSPEKFWTEGGYSRDMIIRNNQFIDCGYGWANPGSSQAAMINILGMGNPNQFAGPGNHQNILIENNTFTLCYLLPVEITSATAVTMKNNLFNFTHFQQNNSGSKFGIDQSRLYWIKNSEDVKIVGNKLQNPGPFLNSEMVFSENTKDLQMK